tara:strand:+ start:134 stop:301 length:168 start_codon:yes stop_codon:yes gene_type:complete
MTRKEALVNSFTERLYLPTCVMLGLDPSIQATGREVDTVLQTCHAAAFPTSDKLS